MKSRSGQGEERWPPQNPQPFGGLVGIALFVPEPQACAVLAVLCSLLSWPTFTARKRGRGCELTRMANAAFVGFPGAAVGSGLDGSRFAGCSVDSGICAELAGLQIHSLAAGRY
jgi:hypothetical protein